MKKNRHSFFLLFVILISFTNYAQEKELLHGDLTPEQHILLRKQRELMIENREKFKASLTAEQTNILESKELSPKAQQEALMASLNEAQKALIFENISKAKKIKDEFRSTLSEEQRHNIRRMKRGRAREFRRDFLPSN